MLLRVVQRYRCVLQLRDQTTHHLVHNTGQSKLLHVRSLLGQSNVLRSIRTSIRHRNSLHANLQPVESPYGGGSIPSNNVMKALIFTGTFSLASFFGATVLEYENTRNMMLDKARQAKLSWMIRKTNESNFWLKLKGDVKRAWEQLSPGDRVFIPICALNVLVFLAWRLPILKEPMLKYFCSNPASRAVCWPMLFSTFSHYSALHLSANMYVLHSFSSVIVASLGKEQFLGLYLSAGVVSSLTSILYKSLTGQAGLSLGASGAIMAVLAYVCAQYPDTKLTILFLPMLSFSAGSAIKVIMGVDFAGCVLGWKFFDHAAHLGGALFGLFWAFYGLEVWHKRIPFLTKYHDWRKTK